MTPADRPNRLPWPPIIYASVIAAALALHWLAPLDWLPRGWGWRLIGAVAAAIGIATGSAGFVAFRRAGTPVDPTKQAETLVMSGVYAHTRNPMYLGMTLTYLGLGLAFASEWLVILALLMPLALQKLAIEREERHLAARFGEVWLAYAARVRRWL